MEGLDGGVEGKGRASLRWQKAQQQCAMKGGSREEIADLAASGAAFDRDVVRTRGQGGR